MEQMAYNTIGYVVDSINHSSATAIDNTPQ